MNPSSKRKGRNETQGESYWLEEIASCLQGEVVGRATTGFGIPEEEGLLGVLVRLAEGVAPEDVDLLSAPPGHYPYDQVDELRRAVELLRPRSEVEETAAAIVAGEILDDFASLRDAFLAPLESVDPWLGPGWRLHAVARRPGVPALGVDDLGAVYGAMTGLRDEVWQFDASEPEAFRFNGFKPHLLASRQGSDQTVFGKVINEGRIDVASITRAWLGERSRSHLVDGVEVEGVTHDALRALVGEWCTRANELLRTFMVDPPELSFQLGDAVDWLVGQTPGWAGLDLLSFAQRRWAQVAIAWSADTGDATYLIIDEPERGLHRAAEAHMADGLRALVSRGVRLITATHSPELIDTDLGQLIYMERGAAPKEVTRAEATELRSFGMQPTSLLSGDRGYLVVEGEHDRQILEGYFGAELKEMRVEVLVMRGAKNVVTILDSDFLVQRTNAVLMPLLDDVALEPLLDLWAGAIAATDAGRRSDAVGIVKRGLDRIPGKGKDAYGPFLMGTIMLGKDLERFLPLGMSKKDVLEYLPVHEIVPDAESWDALWRAFSTSPAVMAKRAGTEGLGKAYKEWLRRVKHADLSPENLRRVADVTIGAPPELKAMIARIAERLDQRDSRAS